MRSPKGRAAGAIAPFARLPPGLRAPLTAPGKRVRVNLQTTGTGTAAIAAGNQLDWFQKEGLYQCMGHETSFIRLPSTTFFRTKTSD
jgi:hypothetical protein